MPVRFLPAALLLLGACSIEPGNSGSPQASSNSANASGSESAKGGAAASNGEKGGAAGKSGAAKGGAAANGSQGGAAASSAVGQTGTQPDTVASSGSAGEAELDPTAVGSTGGQAGEPRPPCDLEGNCDPKIEDTQVTCGVAPGNECEFAGFVGATAQVSPGQRVVIGTACCGQCECVPVEVYFDGERCWQGMSRCNPELLNPHPTTTPNPAFTSSTEVYGSFYLGSAGFDGREASGGAAGTGSAGTGGGGASGIGGTAMGGGGGSAP